MIGARLARTVIFCPSVLLDSGCMHSFAEFAKAHRQGTKKGEHLRLKYTCDAEGFKKYLTDCSSPAASATLGENIIHLGSEDGGKARAAFLRTRDTFRARKMNTVEGSGGGNQMGWRATGFVNLLERVELVAGSTILWIGCGNAAELLSLMSACVAANQHVGIIAFNALEHQNHAVKHIVLKDLHEKQRLVMTAACENTLFFHGCALRFMSGDRCGVKDFEAHTLQPVYGDVARLMHAMCSFVHDVNARSQQEHLSLRSHYVYTGGDDDAALTGLMYAFSMRMALSSRMTFIKVGYHSGLSNEDTWVDLFMGDDLREFLSKADMAQSTVNLEGPSNAMRPARIYRWHEQPGSQESVLLERWLSGYRQYCREYM